MPRSYVDNASNRSLGRVGMAVGSMPVSRGSSGGGYSGGGNSSGGYSGSSASGGTKTYADNAYNRNVGRVGMEHGSAVMSKSSSSSSYLGTSSSGGTKTYADNSYNRSVGRVGMEHGTAVISKDSHSSSHRPSSSSSTNTYVDNSYNRSHGRVGLPHGAAVISKSSSSSTSNSKYPQGHKVYVDNKMNRALGRVGKPLGSMTVSNQTKCTHDLYKKMMLQSDYRSYQDMSDHGYASDVHDESVEMLNDILNRMKQVQIWQSRSMSSKQPKTSTHTIKEYRGVKIDFSELTLKTKIGHGGFGDVHYAEWKGDVVAVKKLRVQRVSKKRAREFFEEVNHFCELEHPNIVQFIGACVTTPNLCMVMEYMQCSLYEALHITEQDLTEPQKLSIIKQSARGMRYLHRIPLAHCDMKSSNVLLNMEDPISVKITDFGLSIMKNETESSVSTIVQNIGTPRYSAPEVLQGEFLNLASMLYADMYSFSLVVYEVLYDAEPFDGYNIHQLRKHVGEGTVIPDIRASSSGSGVKASLISTLESCWNRKAHRRPSASEFYKEVKHTDFLYNFKTE